MLWLEVSTTRGTVLKDSRTAAFEGLRAAGVEGWKRHVRKATIIITVNEAMKSPFFYELCVLAVKDGGVRRPERVYFNYRTNKYHKFRKPDSQRIYTVCQKICPASSLWAHYFSRLRSLLQGPISPNRYSCSSSRSHSMLPWMLLAYFFQHNKVKTWSRKCLSLFHVSLLSKASTGSSSLSASNKGLFSLI